MLLSVCVILKTTELRQIEAELDAFLMNNTENPFILTESIADEMDSALVQHDIPVVLVFRDGKKIVGLSPLLFRQRLGVRFAQLLFGYDYSPDLFFDEKYRHSCIQKTLDFVFDRLGSRYSSLDLPSDSLNCRTLESICQANKIGLRIKNYDNMQHCVLPVDCTWEEFQKSKSSNYRHRFKNIEKKLRNAGEWKVYCVEGNDEDEAVLGRIMQVEETCWKQDWRASHKISLDPYLQKNWRWTGKAAKGFPGYKRGVWFLELNGRVIAYSLVVQYKGTAYISKTSYNNQFRRLYPGIYLINTVIRDLYNSGNVRLIDFMTNLPFMEIWTQKRFLRVRLSLSRGFVPRLLESTIKQAELRLLLQRLAPKK